MTTNHTDLIRRTRAEAEAWDGGSGDVSRLLREAADALEAMQADAARSKSECDAITDINHTQWLALENVRTLAARKRHEEWAKHILRWCEEAGNASRVLRQVSGAAAPVGEPAGELPPLPPKRLLATITSGGWDADEPIYGYTSGDLMAYAREAVAAAPTLSDEQIDAAVNRFLVWKLPTGFFPDCGISFDGRKDDEWNKNKTWPIGTNLLTATQAREMLEHIFAIERAHGIGTKETP